MKRILISVIPALLFILHSNTSIGQTGQGNLMVGANISNLAFTKDKIKQGSITTDQQSHVRFTFTPSAAIFVIRNLAIGLNMRVTSNTDKSDDKQTYRKYSTAFTIGPMARYYFLFAGDKLGLFLHGNISFGSMKDEVDQPLPTITKYGLIEGNVGPGFTVFLNKNVGIETSLYYTGMRMADNASPVKNIIKQNGLTLNLGFQIYFGGK